VGLFGLLLTDDLVYFQLASIFGWSVTPAAFQVVTRAISWELKHTLRSTTLMYVDDIIGVCFAEYLESDLAATRGIWTALLGSGAVADDKTETRMRLDIICLLHNLLAYYEGTHRAELFPHRTTWIHQHGCGGEN
jgi:hypothetical protein